MSVVIDVSGLAAACVVGFWLGVSVLQAEKTVNNTAKQINVRVRELYLVFIMVVFLQKYLFLNEV